MFKGVMAAGRPLREKPVLIVELLPGRKRGAKYEKYRDIDEESCRTEG